MTHGLFECAAYRARITEKTCIPRFIKAKLLGKAGKHEFEFEKCAGCPKGQEMIMDLLEVKEAVKKRGRPIKDDSIVNIAVDLSKFPKVQASLMKLAKEVEMVPGELLIGLIESEIKNLEGRFNEERVVIIEEDNH